MANEGLGWLSIFGSVGAMLFVGSLLSWPVAKFNILKVAISSILLGLAFVAAYVAYAVTVNDFTVTEILSLQTPPSEVKRLMGKLSVFPFHLLGYVLIAGGVLYMPFSIWLRNDANNP